MGTLLVLLAAAAIGDGKALYREHCAGCHGKEGAGDGPLAKDLRFKPRAFVEGKFAFGNTVDAMVKTVMSGIPGEEVSRMPPFKSVMNEEEIKSVVDFVRTMMPEQPKLSAADMKMDVVDRAKVIRGILAPLREGEKPLARGLLVGLPSGFSFEYANDDLFHLVAVRRGDFATRSDWEGRGGRPLTPLGAAVWIAPPASATAAWAPFVLAEASGASDRGAFHRMEARLRGTEVVEDGVVLAYDLIDAAGKVRASVRELPREIVVAGGAGVIQDFELRALGEPVTLLASFASTSDPKLPLPAAGEAPEPPGNEGELERHAREQQALMNDCGWWVIRAPDATYTCVKIDGRGATASAACGAAHDAIDLRVTVGRDPVAVRRTAIFRKDATLESLRAMARELQ